MKTTTTTTNEKTSTPTPNAVVSNKGLLNGKGRFGSPKTTPKTTTPKNKTKKTKQVEVPKNQTTLTMFLKKKECQEEQEEEKQHRVMTRLVDDNTNTQCQPTTKVHDLEVKPAKVKMNVMELTKFFNIPANTQPPPPPKFKSEQVPTILNGRRPRMKNTGDRCISKPEGGDL